MSASWVKTVAAVQTSGTTVSSNITPTNAGDLVVADIYDGNGSSQNGDTVSDGTSYTQDGFRGLLNDGDTVMTFSRPNVPASALTVTASRGSSGGSFRIILNEYTGVVTASPRDGSAVTGYSGTGGTSISTSALTPSQAGDVLHGVVGVDNNLTSAAGASGFTVETNQFTSGQSVAACDQILAGSGATALAMTVSGSGEWAAVLVAYKAVASGGSTTTKVMEDDLTIADGDVLVRRFRRQLEDDLTVTDGDILLRRYRRQLEDDLTIADGDVLIRRFRRQLEDDLTIADAQLHSVMGSGTVYAKVMEDDLLIVDDAGQRYCFRVRALTDSLVLADGDLITRKRGRVMEDDLTVSDGALLIRRRVLLLEDDLTLTDEKLSTFIPAVTFAVRIRIGGEDPIRLGGCDDWIVLGGE